MMPRSLKNENGLAFILVVWVLVLLITLGAEFAFSMRTEVNTTRNFKEDTQAYHLAKAGVNLAMAEILKPVQYHSMTQERGFIFGPPPAITAVKTETSEEETEATEDLPEEVIREAIPLGIGTITYTIEDENGKLNINKVSRDILVKALAANGMEQGSKRDSVADAILDWIDEDDNHRLNGAESDYYQSRFPPYRAKNGPIDALDELLLVKGVTPELLEGSKDYKEAEPEEDQHPGLKRLFTALNTPFFNPNTASREVLKLVFPEEKVAEIVTSKEQKGFYGETLSSHFRIRATGNIENSATRHTVVAVIEKVGTKSETKLLIRYWNDNDLTS